MKFIQLFLVSCLASASIFSSSISFAHGYEINDIAIKHPWAKATAPNQPVGGGYMGFDNKGKTDDALIAVKASVSKSVELHTMSMDNGVMKMRQVPKISIPAGAAVKLAPGGFHVMFIGLNAGLKEGDKFDAVLVFEKAGEVKVQFNVESGAASTGAHH